MSDSDLLSPSASPNRASNSTAGVRRVNNMPLVFVGAAVLIFLGATAAVAISRSENQQRTEQAEEKGGDSLQSAQDIIGDNKGGLVPPQKPELPLPVEQFVGSGAPLPEGIGPGMPPAVIDEAAEALKRAKLARLEEAVRAKTKVESAVLRGDAQGFSASDSPQDARGGSSTHRCGRQRPNSHLSGAPRANQRIRPCAGRRRHGCSARWAELRRDEKGGGRSSI
jgi:hypothetical protein